MSQELNNFLVGVISDTHGFMHSGIAQVFKDVDMIIHAGDIDHPEVLDALQKIASVKAVRGNMDYREWAHTLPLTDVVEAGEVLLYVLHDLSRLDLDPAASGFSAVINGHTHRPAIERKNGVLFLNPGSSGQSRHHCPLSVALLRIQGTVLDAHIVELED